MAELYHIKKKNENELEANNPYDKSKKKNVIGNIKKSVESSANKIKSYGSYAQMKKKLGNNSKLVTSTSFASPVSNAANSIKKVGAVANFNKNFKPEKKPERTEEDEELNNNPPKKLRKKLNNVQLRNIVGPKK